MKKLYDRIHLNLGIKRQIPLLLLKLDNSLIFPFHNVLQRYLFKRIVQYYGADYRWDEQWSQNIDKATSNPGFGLFHYSLIRNIKPKRILCIGSMYGYIPFMMALACSENKFGTVDFVDAGYDIGNEDDNHFYGVGLWKKINVKEYFKYLLKDSSYLRPYIIDSEQFAKKYKYKYDYIYFDGDHSFEGALRDLKLFWPRLNDNGFLCLHDVKVTEGPGGIKFEFWKVWKLLKNFPHKFEVANPYAALGMIQKMNGATLPTSVLRKTTFNAKER